MGIIIWNVLATTSFEVKDYQKKKKKSIPLGRSYLSLLVQKQQNEEHFIMYVIYYIEWWEM